MDKVFTQVFDQFLRAYIELNGDDQQNLWTYYEADWLSPCYLEHASQDEKVKWQPVLRDTPVDMSNIAEALEIKIPRAFSQFFGRYYSHDLLASTTRGDLTLLQVWNDDDFERLQKNLIAHVLMKRKLKQPDTLFFALTDEDDFNIVLDVESGQVMLERVGKVPQEVLASTITDFISTLKPRLGQAGL